MFKQLDIKVIGGIVIIAVLLGAGIHFYSKWSYNRFASDTQKSGNENVKVKPKLMVKSELVNTTKENEASAEKTETPEFDASSLMSTFGIPEEVKALLDEDAEEADFEKAKELDLDVEER